MRFKKLDLNLLPVLDTLIRTRNVSRAAEEMFISQSAMSNALARLRDYFDDPLLIQVGREMRPSPFAEELTSELRSTMLRIETLTEKRAAFDPRQSERRFGIALSDYSLRTFIAQFISELLRQAPGISIDLLDIRDHPDTLLNRSDIQILIAPKEVCSARHPSALLVRDRLCCVVGSESSHPSSIFTTEEFNRCAHIIFRPPDGSESFTLQACNNAGLNVSAKISTFTFESMCDMVRGTNLVGIIQHRLASLSQRERGGLRIVDMPHELPQLDLMIQWHSARSEDLALKWLIGELKSAVKGT